jgi:putative heme-binding domain-containing protein
MTHCRSYWGGGGTTNVIRNGHFWNQTNADYPDFISNAAAPGLPHLRNFLPASARYDSGEGGAGKPGTDAVFGGHSHVGTMIYGGDNWPEIYRDHLFTHNLHGHQINHQVNVRVGSAYETFHGGYDLAYVADPAYVAVELKYGPDGAVYVIDWVDRQHCHNPRPENWDRTNGRIYRISWAKTYHPCKVDLTSKSDAELIELLGHRNRWFANTSRRILQHRAAERSLDVNVQNKLVESARGNGAVRQVLESLWALHAIGRFDASVAQEAIAHPDDAVRANAVRLATDERSSLAISIDQLLRLASDDPSPRMRLAIASAMPVLPPADRWRVAAALAQHAEDAADRFLPDMIWYGLAPLVADNVAGALALADDTPLPALSDAIVWYAARLPSGRDQIIRRVGSRDDKNALRLLNLMHFSLQNESRLSEPLEWDRVRQRFSNGSNSADAPAARICDELSAVFGVEAVLQQMRGVLVSQQATVAQRRRALAILHRVGDRESVAIYPKLLSHPALRLQVIPLLAGSQDPAVAGQLLRSMPDFTPEEKAAALGVLTSRKQFALELLKAVDQGTLDRAELSALQIRQVHSLGDPELNVLLEKVWGKIGASSQDAQRLIGKVRTTYTTAPLWAYSEARGQQVFQKTCANCHPLDGSAVPLGPGLKGSWRNGLDYFLENIIDPNAVVGENYRLTQIVTRSGQVISGLLDSESATAVVLRTADATVTVPTSEIDERQLVDQSLMPTGLLDNMSEIEIIELLKFLLRQE